MVLSLWGEGSSLCPDVNSWYCTLISELMFQIWAWLLIQSLSSHSGNKIKGNRDIWWQGLVLGLTSATLSVEDLGHRCTGGCCFPAEPSADWLYEQKWHLVERNVAYAPSGSGMSAHCWFSTAPLGHERTQCVCSSSGFLELCVQVRKPQENGSVNQVYHWAKGIPDPQQSLLTVPAWWRGYVCMRLMLGPLWSAGGRCCQFPPMGCWTIFVNVCKSGKQGWKRWN